MKTLVQLERLQKMHQLIKATNTGTPKEFADNIGISQSHLYFILDDLKIKGFPIIFLRNLKSYTYSSYCHLEIKFSIKIFTESGEIEIKENKE